MKLQNPFPEYGYFGPAYFCDREAETEELIEALLNGSNVTLMAPRRIGKTGLIHHVFGRMKERDKSVQCFYVDIFSTKTFSQMVQMLANAVMGKLDNDDVLNAVNRIIGEQEINYQNNYNLLTENQAALLTAIAKQGVVSARQGVPVP